jgi:predicted nucleic acid-binding protein
VVKDKLVADVKAAEQPWMAAFGKLWHLSKETRKLTVLSKRSSNRLSPKINNDFGHERLSALAEGELRLEPILRKATQVAVPVIVLGEYRNGIRQSRERQRYEHWLVEYRPTFRVLNVDEQTATPYAAVCSELKRAGTPIPFNDVWIAALRRQHSPFLRATTISCRPTTSGPCL